MLLQYRMVSQRGVSYKRGGCPGCGTFYLFLLSPSFPLWDARMAVLPIPNAGATIQDWVKFEEGFASRADMNVRTLYGEWLGRQEPGKGFAESDGAEEELLFLSRYALRERAAVGHEREWCLLP